MKNYTDIYYVRNEQNSETYNVRYNLKKQCVEIVMKPNIIFLNEIIKQTQGYAPNETVLKDSIKLRKQLHETKYLVCEYYYVKRKVWHRKKWQVLKACVKAYDDKMKKIFG